MFRIQQLTHFGTPAAAAAPQIPPAAQVGGTWAQGSDDPFFIEINPAAMGYRSRSERLRWQRRTARRLKTVANLLNRRLASATSRYGLVLALAQTRCRLPHDKLPKLAVSRGAAGSGLFAASKDLSQ
jgi:hypothetical protein